MASSYLQESSVHTLDVAAAPPPTYPFTPRFSCHIRGIGQSDLCYPLTGAEHLGPVVSDWVMFSSTLCPPPSPNPHKLSLTSHQKGFTAAYAMWTEAAPSSVRTLYHNPGKLEKGREA